MGTRGGPVDPATIRRRLAKYPPTPRRLRMWRFRTGVQKVIVRQLARTIRLVERNTTRWRGNAVRCPLCGWEGFRFRPEIRSGHIARDIRCPGCGSVERHRLFALACLEHAPPRGRCLHLAPERWLQPLVRRSMDRVFTADLERNDVDFRVDLERLPIADDALDVVICSDVLEHVEDDVRAMREVARVLAGGGFAYIHVPIVATETVEYGFPVAIDHGHRRAYGPDVRQRLDVAGIQIRVYSAERLSEGERRRWGVRKDDRVFIGSAGRRAGPRTV